MNLRHYNQLLLAIGGTAGLVFFLLLGAFTLADEFESRSYRSAREEEGIAAKGVTDELLADSLRRQIVSLDRIQLIDSSRKIYVLPVGQADLSEAESLDQPLGLLNIYKSSGRYSKDYDPYAPSPYNNLVLFKSTEGRSRIVFDRRISVGGYEAVEHAGGLYLLITGAGRDSDGNGLLNRKDRQQLFIYEVESETLHPVPFREEVTLLDLFQNPQTREVIGRFGLDRDENGTFDSETEPAIIQLVDLNEKALRPVLAAGQLDTLQRLLEGRTTTRREN